jgi:hypothetical protein
VRENDDLDDDDDDEDDGAAPVCEHNDHGHLMLWFAIFAVGVGLFSDCNSDYRKLERENQDLRRRIDQLELRQR